MLYTIKNFEQNLTNKPHLIRPVLSFMKRMMGKNIQKFAIGKNQTEFANVVVIVLPSNLSQEMTRFLAYHLYPYIQNDSLRIVKKIDKLSKEKKHAKIIKPLLSILKKGSVTKTPTKKIGFWKKQVHTIAVKKKVIGNKVKTIVQSGPRVVKRIFKEETFTSASAPLKKNKTILGTTSPLRDRELENLRVQTLVSFDSQKSLLKWISIPNEKQLLKSRPLDFFKILKSISLVTKLSKEQKSFVSCLKNTLMIRSKLLFQDQIVINVINEGMKSYFHTLKKLSCVCTKKSINKKIWEYMHENTQRKLKNFANFYRQELGRVSSADDLEKLVKKYPLLSNSTVKKYKELYIIKNVKDIFNGYNQNPQKLNSLLNKCLGNHGEANVKAKLTKVLVTTSGDMDIFRKIQREKNVFNCIKVLEENKNNSIASKVLAVVLSFMKSENKKSFTKFKGSLNFVSSPLAKKVESLMRSHLVLDLNKNVKSLLYGKDDPLASIRELIKILKSPKYVGADVSIFETSPVTLAEKITALKGNQNQLKRYIEHSFPSPQFPKIFRDLLEKAKITQSSLGEKSIENFQRALNLIEQKIRKKEIVIVKSEIINLFKSYGNISFSRNTQQFINGYAIARSIEEYYRNPRRNDIQLSQDISPSIRRKVKSMIDNERKRQLHKLRDS